MMWLDLLPKQARVLQAVENEGVAWLDGGRDGGL
jgi:hypothetical protein